MPSLPSVLAPQGYPAGWRKAAGVRKEVGQEAGRSRAADAPLSLPPCGEEVEVGVCASAYEGVAPTPPPGASRSPPHKGEGNRGAALSQRCRLIGDSRPLRGLAPS